MNSAGLARGKRARGAAARVAAALLLVAAGACARTPAENRAPARPLTGLSLIPARSGPDKSLGLQHVERLPPDTGVIFFLDPARAGRPVHFHSRHCLFTIGMAALDREGRILKLHDLPPESAVAFPPGTALVIETSAGWFAARGFRVGDRIDRRSLEAAVDETRNVREHLERRPPARGGNTTDEP